jgi:hypothetical protein
VPGQLRDRFEDAYGTIVHVNDDGTAMYGGRGAVFARGALGGGAELTFRYDSEHAHDRRRFDDIRPEEGDNVFGDASIQGFEAQSTERLYARLDRGASYALYGDFMTDGLDPIRRLGAYTRGINGARAHGEGQKVALDAFASHDRDRQVIDEVPGKGISGPYPLSRKDGVLNSEKVEIVTRDRNNPSVILERRTLVRFADYTIEPFTGRLLFRMPVASLDERLNPVSIRVTYEVEGGGDRFWTAGGSAHLKPVDRIELMGNYVKEDDPLAAHEQFGAGTTLRVLERTYLTGEWAHSDSAGTLASEAYRGEIRHASKQLDLRAFGLRTDPGFNNPSSGYVPGREEWGGDARYALGRKTIVSAEAVRTRDVVTEGRRKGASLAIDHRLSGALSLGVGYRWARESAVPAGGGPAVPTPNDVDAARARIALQLGMRTSAFAEYEKSVGVGDAKRLALGADIRATDHVRAYARHEFLNSLAGPYALNDAQEQSSTVFGFAADGYEDLTAFSEYRIRDAFAGREAEAAIGLRDRFRISPAVRVLLSMERVAQDGGSGVTALASGLEWTGDPLTKGTARLEFRDATNDQQWLASAGLARRMGRDWTGLVRSRWSWSPGQRADDRARRARALAARDRRQRLEPARPGRASPRRAAARRHVRQPPRGVARLDAAELARGAALDAARPARRQVDVRRGLRHVARRQGHARLGARALRPVEAIRPGAVGPGALRRRLGPSHRRAGRRARRRRDEEPAGSRAGTTRSASTTRTSPRWSARTRDRSSPSASSSTRACSAGTARTRPPRSRSRRSRRSAAPSSRRRATRSRPARFGCPTRRSRPTSRRSTAGARASTRCPIRSASTAARRRAPGSTSRATRTFRAIATRRRGSRSRTPSRCTTRWPRTTPRSSSPRRAAACRAAGNDPALTSSAATLHASPGFHCAEGGGRAPRSRDRVGRARGTRSRRLRGDAAPGRGAPARGRREGEGRRLHQGRRPPAAARAVAGAGRTGRAQSRNPRGAVRHSRGQSTSRSTRASSARRRRTWSRASRRCSSSIRT